MRSKTIAAALAALWLGAGCAYYNTFYYARQDWAEAEKARLESPDGKANKRAIDLYEKCMKKCAKVLTDYDKSRWVDDALLMMGRCAVARGEYPTGLRKFEELIKFYPNSPLVPEARLALGKGHREEGSPAPAVAALQAVLDDPKAGDLHGEAQYELGLARLAAGDSAGCVEALEAFVSQEESHPQRKHALETIASVQFARGEHASSRAAYERIRPHPRRDWATYRTTRMAIGRTYRLEGKMDEALREFALLLPMTRDIRDSAEIWEERALVARDEGNDSLAVALLGETAVRFGHTDGAARALYERGEIQYETYGDLEGARRSYDSVSVHTGALPELALAKREAAVLGARLALDEQLVMRLQRLEAANQGGGDPATAAPGGSPAPGDSAAVPEPTPTPVDTAAAPAMGPLPAPADAEAAPATGTPYGPVAPDVLTGELPPAKSGSPAAQAAESGTGKPDPAVERPPQTAAHPDMRAGAVPPPAAARPPGPPASGAHHAAAPDSATGTGPSVSPAHYLAELTPERRSELFALADSAAREELAGIFLRIGEVELLDLGRTELAVTAYETVVEEFSSTAKYPQAELSLAWIESHREGRTDEAEARYRKVLEEHPGTRWAAAAALALGIEDAVPDSVMALLAASLEPEEVEPARPVPAAAAPRPTGKQPPAEGEGAEGEPLQPPPDLAEPIPGTPGWPDSVAGWPDSVAARADSLLSAEHPVRPPLPGEEPPRVLSLAVPIYSKVLADAEVKGSVTVEVTVGPAGLPTDARVTRSDNPDLDGAAVVAALGSVFTPPHGQNHAVITFTFPPEEQ